MREGCGETSMLPIAVAAVLLALFALQVRWLAG
jgi:hypothetical protein